MQVAPRRLQALGQRACGGGGSVACFITKHAGRTPARADPWTARLPGWVGGVRGGVGGWGGRDRFQFIELPRVLNWAIKEAELLN